MSWNWGLQEASRIAEELVQAQLPCRSPENHAYFPSLHPEPTTRLKLELDVKLKRLCQIHSRALRDFIQHTTLHVYALRLLGALLSYSMKGAFTDGLFCAWYYSFFWLLSDVFSQLQIFLLFKNFLVITEKISEVPV
jgi:hypothetical protein